MLPALPSLPGHSQSMSKPSNSPAAEPGPPASPGPRNGRLPLMNRSTQDDTKAARDCGVSAASEKYFDHDQPPSDRITLSCGYLAFSLSSCPKLALSGSPHWPATPSTLLPAAIGCS